MIMCEELEVYLQNPQKRVLFKAPLLRFTQGHRYAIMGPSGCGKSVLTKYLAGLLPGSATKLKFGSKGFTKSRSILYLPQDSKDSILPWRNTFDVLHNKESALVDVLGLSENFKRRQYPKNMSGGELRRLALGELLSMGEREFLILDEPLNGLDEDLRGKCSQAINFYMSKYPKTCLIFVTHYQQEKESLNAELIRCVTRDNMGVFEHE